MWFNQIALGGIVRVASIVNFLDCYRQCVILSYENEMLPYTFGAGGLRSLSVCTPLKRSISDASTITDRHKSITKKNVYIRANKEYNKLIIVICLI